MKISLLSFLTAIEIVAQVNAQDHGHLNLGASGGQVIFANAGIFDTNSLYVKTLTFTNGGRYAGYFQGNITFTGLAATELRGGPEENAAAIGARLYAQIVSVEGPTGGAFNFWESTGGTPAITVPCGTGSTNLFIVSENDGAPDADPYGHIHGRRFTATKAGIYTVAFRAFDLSANGFGGGPIHAPSEVIKVYFQAGINLAGVTISDGAASITFGSLLNHTFHLEGSPDLNETNGWTQIGDAVPGDDALQTITDTNAISARRFYRLRITTP